MYIGKFLVILNGGKTGIDMLSTKEQQKRVRDNFKKIMETHAKNGQPVVIGEGEKIFHLYEDGSKIDVTQKIKKITETGISF